MAYACREESKTIHLCEDTFVQCFSRWCLPMTYAENINQFLALHLAHCNGRYCNADHGYTFEAWFWWLFSIVFTPDLLSWLTGVRGQHCRVQCWKKLDLHLGIRRDEKANIWKGETADKGREFPYRHREYLQIPRGRHFLFIEQTYQKIPYKCSWPPDVMHDSFIGLMRKRLGGWWTTHWENMSQWRFCGEPPKPCAAQWPEHSAYNAHGRHHRWYGIWLMIIDNHWLPLWNWFDPCSKFCLQPGNDHLIPFRLNYDVAL